jgi:hypothetical protein
MLSLLVTSDQAESWPVAWRVFSDEETARLRGPIQAEYLETIGALQGKLSWQDVATAIAGEPVVTDIDALIVIHAFLYAGQSAS